ncbi:hypothetical protein [Blastochloris viridis]|uniref:DUF3035 domain-containing protein n=1 Tax=Blastochloris viridis TaxID=1079 RepID=A0A0H5BBG8_BLAVI|nr:hypothetical protein [Blastochloris viridis]ALK10465.1 hypothetical protein BVIR_2700 [Blastochloris viridis]BAR99592.1 hypothetical protein BV133_1999 [Blastochloris viridis]CUU43127.1 hypothetical protein BVIRIDIS_21440 [Blastochloris viridis]
MKTGFVRRILPLVVLAAVALPNGARAEDDEPSIEQKVIKNLLGGVGLIENKPPIDYRERAPLVVPPSTEALPPPRTDDAAAANPAWPRDPDVVRAKAAAEADVSRPVLRTDSGRALGIDEIRRGRTKQAKDDEPQKSSDYFEGANDRLSPGQLGFTGWGMKKDEKIVFTGEPDRTRLTQPPPGLQTPSPDQPYGVIGDDKLDDNWLNRIFSPGRVAAGRDSGADRSARDNTK